MQPGQMLSHYRVEEKIGAGGMGEVYRAHDTVLSRDVALKILPPEFATDSERMIRFEREAKVLASLHHPNIASIFGFENTSECTFLVMELVAGEDLSEVLKSGPLPVEEAIDIARQIAEGLEEAHEKGIIHRDLKPANVKRTPDGKVKVLDFGLARAYTGEGAGEGEMSSMLTMTAAMTQVGTVMGTAAYMSPEQARGKEVDRRTDIWAFGVMLFEMLTGEQMFVGETATDTLAGILKSEPDWNKLPKGLPFQVEQVIRRCLAKDPRQRLRDIGEARVRLEDPDAESGMFTAAVPIMAAPSQRRRKILTTILVSTKLAVIVWLVFFRGSDVVAPPLMHVAVPSPSGVRFHVTGSFPGLPAISPTGTHIVFSGNSDEDNKIQLYVRDLTAPDAMPLAGTDDAQYPFWSPDGRWVAYYARDKGLMKVKLDGSPPQLICKADNGKGGSWNQFGQILFAASYNSSIQVVDAAGGEPRPVTFLDQDDEVNSHRHPQFLPDGEHFLYLARSINGSLPEIRMASLTDSTHHVVTNQPYMVQYTAGHLLFLNGESLMAQPFDAESGELSGSSVRIAEGVMTVQGAAKGGFSASDEGSLVYLRGFSTRDASLNWLDRDGKNQGQLCDDALYDMAVLSPDGRWAAVGIIDPKAGTWDVWLVDVARNFRTRFTNTPADEFGLVWQKDSRALFFSSDRGGEGGVYRKEIGAAGEAELIFSLEKSIYTWDCTSDGNTLVYSVPESQWKQDIWSVNIADGSEPHLLWRTEGDDVMARFSPDDKWLTFAQSVAGKLQVFVAPWPAMSPVTQVSINSGSWSFWSKGGRELVYQEMSGAMVAVPVGYENGDIRIGTPTALFELNPPVFEGALISVSSDGEQFLEVEAIDSDPSVFCDLILNWPGILEER